MPACAGGGKKKTFCPWIEGGRRGGARKRRKKKKAQALPEGEVSSPEGEGARLLGVRGKIRCP